MMENFINAIIELPLIFSILLKITIILGLGWLINYVLANHNPRWRVLLWRCVIISIFLVPALAPVKYFQIRVIKTPDQIVEAESNITAEPIEIINPAAIPELSQNNNGVSRFG